MRSFRYVSFILAVGLVALVIAFTQVFVISSKAEHNTNSYLGMGDLHVAESQQGIIPVTGVQSNGQSYAGMGDLRRLDAQISGLNHPYVGMGDLQRFDANR